MNNVTLHVNGREANFSEQGLIAIAEKYLSSKIYREDDTVKAPKKPTEGVWFEVKPQAIDQRLFKEERRDEYQEETRRKILRAFAKMKENPESYGKNFKTLMPKKTWESKTVSQLREMASELGDHNADWVEQALEWAQRIANGESWEEICNVQDTANWIRLVTGQVGNDWFVGGAFCIDCRNPASGITSTRENNRNCYPVIPLVVSYEK